MHAPSLNMKGILDHQREPVSKILDAAEHCVRLHGYAETTTRIVAREANVSKSLLHYHFQSKAHIFIELQIRLYNRIAAQIRDVVAAEGSTTEKSLRGLDAVYQVVTNSDDLPVHIEIWSRSFGDETLRSQMIRFREYLREVLIHILDELVREEIKQLPLSVETAADLALAMFTGLKLNAGFEPDRERFDRAYADLKRIIAHTLSIGGYR